MIEPGRAVVLNVNVTRERVLITPMFVAKERSDKLVEITISGGSMNRPPVTMVIDQTMDDLVNAFQALPIDSSRPKALGLEDLAALLALKSAIK